MTVLSVENLTLSYRTGREWREVVHNVSFTLGRGEKLAFVGEAGSGQTKPPPRKRLSACWRITPAATGAAFA